MTLKITKELKAGIVAFLALGLMYWGFNFLKGINLFDNRKLVYAVYKDVDGLTPARPLMLNGFQIGQVSRVYFHPNLDGRLIVEMALTTEFEIPKNSIARISSAGIMGDKNVELILGNLPNALSAGDTLLSDLALSLTEEVNKQVLPLKQKTENLLGSLDTAITLISGFLTESTRNNFMASFESVRRSFDNLEHTTQEFDIMVTQTRPGIENIVADVSDLTETLKANEKNISSIIANTKSISDTLNSAQMSKTLASLRKSVYETESILSKLNSGEGTAGQLLNNPELYQQLEASASELKILLTDMKLNPNRYVHFSVFGKNKPFDPKVEKETEIKEKPLTP